MKLRKEIDLIKSNYGVSLTYISKRANVGYKALYNYYKGITNSYTYTNTMKVLKAIKDIETDLILLED